MCELDSEFLILAVQEGGDPLDWRDLGVAPETGVFGCYAAVGEHGGGFDDCQGSTAVGECGSVGGI